MQYPSQFILFASIVFAIYGILGLFFIAKHVRSQLKLRAEIKRSPKKREDSEDTVKNTPFYLIRNQYFPSDLKYNAYFINGHMEEVFGIFIKLSPSMIATLTKADKRILTFKKLIADPLVTEDDIRKEIESVNELLDALIKTSHSMIEKLEDLIVKDRLDDSVVWMDPDIIRVYTQSVNTLTELTNNHSIINFEIHNRLVDKYPNLVEPFRIIAGKITYIFFINLISYSNKIDENLYAYNHIAIE